MGDPRGFLRVKRKGSKYRPVCERVKDYKEMVILRSEEESKEQASRCMDCGTPFCHWGCPIGNLVPDWNDLMFKGHWKEALQLLQATNNLPEITGRICPALCEYACVLGINDDPVTIRENELAIIEYGFKKKLIKPRLPDKRTGKKIAVVGSGPAGLACADQLNKAGHHVRVFEKDDRIGGILQYGVPDFKLEKHLIERREELWRKEGIQFITNTNVGIDLPVEKLKNGFDAVCLAGGSRKPRDLGLEGRDLKGIYFAMDFLIQANKRLTGLKVPADQLIDAKNKNVVVIGGGDTGADCVGVSHRQGARCVVQIEVLSKPADCRTANQPWPHYPSLLKISTSHEEGGERKWSVLTKKFNGEKGHIKKLSCIEVEFTNDEKGCSLMKEIPGSEFEIPCDLAILAVGFVHPEHDLLNKLGVKWDKKGNVQTDDTFMTSVKGIFAAGDMRRGQSLIVWAISEGRRAAYHIDRFLMGRSDLPDF
ncbi:MAG: glutamate synthase subunit beta [Spirochaetes bacterium]|nr:glutamate synthase subunit beta [Spirochaetota bacterium]